MPLESAVRSFLFCQNQPENPYSVHSYESSRLFLPRFLRRYIVRRDVECCDLWKPLFIILIDYWHQNTQTALNYILLLIVMSSLDMNITPIKMLDTSAFMVDPDSDSTDAVAARITALAKGTNTRTTDAIIRNAT
jgi:hypothetical protein